MYRPIYSKLGEVDFEKLKVISVRFEMLHSLLLLCVNKFRIEIKSTSLKNIKSNDFILCFWCMTLLWCLSVQIHLLDKK